MYNPSSPNRSSSWKSWVGEKLLQLFWALGGCLQAVVRGDSRQWQSAQGFWELWLGPKAQSVTVLLHLRPGSVAGEVSLPTDPHATVKFTFTAAHQCQFCSPCPRLLLALAAPVNCPASVLSIPPLLLQPLLGWPRWHCQHNVVSAVGSLYQGICFLTLQLLSCWATAPTSCSPATATYTATSSLPVSSSAALLMKRIRSREGRPLLRSLYWACCYNTREQHRMVSSGWSQSELSSLHAQAKESNKEVSTLITAHP
jgi:hypothetical protein